MPPVFRPPRFVVFFGLPLCTMVDVYQWPRKVLMVGLSEGPAYYTPPSSLRFTNLCHRGTGTLATTVKNINPLLLTISSLF